ncbi:MAG: hypothetical protein IJH91_04885 [Mogibacterium sp.]|nr:hypothetical protein [Mogibacterium sp.]
MAGVILAIDALTMRVWATSLPTVTVTIPVEHLTRGDEWNRTATFVLVARDVGTPMPEGSVDGRKTVTVRGNGMADFGEIRYDYPDVYYYTVFREPADMTGLTEDNAVYDVMVAAFNDGTAKLVIYEKGTDSKAERILYEDVYRDPAAERQAPDTGDETTLPKRYAIAFVSAGTLLIVLWRKKKGEQEEINSSGGGAGTDDYTGRHYRDGSGDHGGRGRGDDGRGGIDYSDGAGYGSSSNGRSGHGTGRGGRSEEYSGRRVGRNDGTTGNNGIGSRNRSQWDRGEW